MALRQSKYKNVKGLIYRPESHYPHLNISQSSGDYNLLASSTEWIATAWQSSPSGAIGVVALNEPGRRKGNVPHLIGHNGQITDLAWNPFHDWVLASSSNDATIKLWKLPEFGLSENLTTPENTINIQGKKAETLAWNPTGFNILASGSADGVINIWDVNQNDSKFSINEWNDSIDSISWNYDGTWLTSVSRDKKLRVIDPRAKSILFETDAHEAIGKPMRVTHLGNLHQIVTTGFDKTKNLQFAIWDERALKKPLNMQTLGASPGVLIPLYDNDTNLLFLTSRGDCAIRIYEITDSAPFLYELTPIVDKQPHRGVCMIPKRACNVMSCEVDRILRATNNSIIPVGFQVPKKTYIDFHEDIFPNTPGPEAALTSQQWLDGEVKQPILVSLNPEQHLSSDSGNNDNNDNDTSDPAPVTNAPRSFNIFDKQEKVVKEDEYYVPKVVTVVRASKYKYIKGTAGKRVDTYENLDILNDAMQNKVIDANDQWFAVIWKGNGGRLAVFDINKDKGRVPVKYSTIETGSSILDFTFNRFDKNMIATGGDNAHIKIWKIPEGGVLRRGSNLLDSESDLVEHSNRITSLEFHPLASNLLLSTAGDLTAKIWDITKGSSSITLTGFNDIITSTSWSYDGSLLGTTSKDGKVRFHDPRSNKLVSEGDDIGGSLGTKLAWLGKQDRVALVGYDKHSERNINIIDIRKPTETFANIKIGSGSGTLNPIYDPDTGILLLWSKGEGAVKFIEINDESPYIHHLTDYSTNIPQVGYAFLPRTSVDVKEVEVFKSYKLTLDKVIPVSFTVPRQKKEYFQDDIYTDTLSSEPTFSASEWLSGSNKQPKLVSLQPKGMKKLSEAPKQEVVRKRVVVDDSEDMSLDKIKNNLVDRIYDNLESYQGKPLPGEDMEGVDSDEWDD